MPSVEHELLVAIVREHPDVVLGLLRSAFGLEYAGEIEVTASSENLSEVRAPERRADAVLVLRRPGETRPHAALIIEIQLRADLRKRLSWPVYIAVTRARLDCPVTLVVIALDATTARWCETPIALDDHGSVLRPRVLGPAQVPTVDVELARRHPELAVLSVLAHRDEPIALELGRALLSACDGLDESRAELYADIVFGFINEAARRALEAEMNLENYEVQSEFLRNLKADARARGEALGQARGRLEALGRAVLKVLQARHLPVTEAQRLTISACNDSDALELWLERAVTAPSADQLFQP